jgi:DNA-damage-inducible protein J
MGKTAYITARVEPKLKASAEGVLQKLGLSTTEAITLFLHQVALRRGLPFEVRIPNAASRGAIDELEAGRGRRFTSVDDLMQDALKKRNRRKA